MQTSMVQYEYRMERTIPSDSEIFAKSVCKVEDHFGDKYLNVMSGPFDIPSFSS